MHSSQKKTITYKHQTSTKERHTEKSSSGPTKEFFMAHLPNTSVTGKMFNYLLMNLENFQNLSCSNVL